MLQYVGTFFVLAENVPLILGMTFLTDVAPVVDWQRKTVRVRGQSLPVQCYGSADVHTNPFSGLSVESGVDTHDDVSNPLVAPGDVACSVSCGCVHKDSGCGERL